MAYLYSHFSHFIFKKTTKQQKIFTSSSLSLSFVRLFCKQLSSSKSSDSVPLRRNEVRSILGDNCPLSSVLIEGPN